MHGLYYYRARYYDPNIGRFISSDPIEFGAGDFNFYRYVGNDPVNRNDPSGHMAQVAVAVEVGAEAGAIFGPLGVAIGATLGGLAGYFASKWAIAEVVMQSSGGSESASDDGIKVEEGSGTSAGAPPPEDPEDEDLPPAKKKASTSKPGEKVRTPDTAKKGDFTKMRGGNYKNNKTGEIWSKSHTEHSGASEWKVGLGKGKTPTANHKITVRGGNGKDAGKIVKVDR